MAREKVRKRNSGEGEREREGGGDRGKLTYSWPAAQMYSGW